MYGLDHGKTRFQPETSMILRPESGIPGLYLTGMRYSRLAPVFKTNFHQCFIFYTCSWFNSDGSVLKQSHQS